MRNDTDYLLASPANARHLLESISRLDARESDRSADHFSDGQIAAAAAAGQERLRTEPRARAARYDAAADRVVLDLVSGATFSFAPWLAQGLRGASAADLAEVEVLGAGFGLHWESLDVDFSVEGLLAGRFGTKRWAEALLVLEINRA